MPGREIPTSKLPVTFICDAHVVAWVATLITEWVAEVIVRDGSIVARNPKEQIGRACFNIQLPQVLSISEANML